MPGKWQIQANQSLNQPQSGALICQGLFVTLLGLVTFPGRTHIDSRFGPGYRIGRAGVAGREGWSRG